MVRVYLKVFVLIFSAVGNSSCFAWLPFQERPVVHDPFERAVGVSEKQFFKEYGFSEEGKELLKNKLQGTQGKFHLKQVEPFVDSSLYQRLKKGEPVEIDPTPWFEVSSDWPYTFSVIEGGEMPSGKNFQKYLDVAALQAAPENKGAVFQVASNLNGLELNGTKSERIYTYIPLKTQGEICALSALPGIIDRMYLQPSISLLAHFNWGGSVPYTEGYFPHFPEMDSRFGNMTYQDILQAAATVSVGIQKDVVVTSGLRDYSKGSQFKAVPVKGSDQRITQIFTAALDPYHNREYQHDAGFENLARTLLHGAYKGTFDAVRELQAKKLFLTLVGGGVFENKFEWIAQAIDAAFRDFCFRKVVGFWGRHEMKPNYQNAQVTLVLYHITPQQKATADWQEAEAVLKNMVTRSGGTWKRYTSKGVEEVI